MFNKIMARERYMEILRCLHFADNSMVLDRNYENY